MPEVEVEVEVETSVFAVGRLVLLIAVRHDDSARFQTSGDLSAYFP